MSKIYVNTLIKAIDDPLKDEFTDYLCETEAESSIAVLSKKNVKPDDIPQLKTRTQGARIILLLDNNDKDLIRAAKDNDIYDLFYSPVKVQVISKRIKKIMDSKTKTPVQKQAAPDTADQDNLDNEHLSTLLNKIAERTSNSSELAALYKENKELKQQLKQYEEFVTALKNIIN